MNDSKHETELLKRALYCRSKLPLIALEGDFWYMVYRATLMGLYSAEYHDINK